MATFSFFGGKGFFEISSSCYHPRNEIGVSIQDGKFRFPGSAALKTPFPKGEPFLRFTVNSHGRMEMDMKNPCKIMKKNGDFMALEFLDGYNSIVTIYWTLIVDTVVNRMQ